MFSLIRFSPFDLRVILRLVTLLLVWKLLSTDFSAFPELVQDPTIYHHEFAPLNRLTALYRPVLFGSVGGVYGVQLTAAALLLLGAWRRQRLAVLAGLLGVLLLEWNAFHYRGVMFEFEVPLIVLLGLALWPVAWHRLLAQSKSPNPEADLSGRFLVALVGMAYLVCGLSKPLVDLNWHRIVNLHLGRTVMLVHFTLDFPAWLDPVTLWLQRLFREHPSLDHLTALSACLVEILWITSLVNVWCRRIVPWSMLLIHVGIFLSMGILFLPFTLTALILVQPWRWWLPEKNSGQWSVVSGQNGSSVHPPVTSGRNSAGTGHWPLATGHRFLLHAAALGLAAFLVILPAVTRVNCQPFVNYNLFGFRYGNFPPEVYRLGYQDATTGRCFPLPQNHGGFMDYRLVTNVEAEIKGYLQATDPGRREDHLRRIWQFQRSVRPAHSERWLLGPLALPPHVIARTETLPDDRRDELHLLRGRLEIRESTVSCDWEDLGPVHKPKDTW